MRFNFLDFSKNEAKFLTFAFFFLIVLLTVNYSISLRKSRDSQRKSDIRFLYEAINRFQNTFGVLPKSVNGKLEACNPQINEEKTGYKFDVCEWGSKEKYFEGILPRDPKYKIGYEYYYLTDGRNFQVFASLEGKKEAEYNVSVLGRQLNCGKFICNTGITSGPPLDNFMLEEDNK